MKPAIIRPDLELKREIKNVPERNLIYIRLSGDYKQNDYCVPGYACASLSENKTCRWGTVALFVSTMMTRK